MNSLSFPLSTKGLSLLSPRELRSGLLGLEREALRVTGSGRLAQTPHPEEFGEKLGGNAITVDFSESQMEFVTQPHAQAEDTLAELTKLQAKADAVLLERGERLWPFSMPPRVCCDEEIPIARFDDSAEGRTLETYRERLARRHGRRMQAISGIHLGLSFGDGLLETLARSRGEAAGRTFSDEAYFGMARNFLRHRWLTVLLTGASPLADESFFAGRPGFTRQPGTESNPFPHAVSLRQSPLGYADTAGDGLQVSFDSLEAHLGDLRSLLASGTLSRESEFYSPLRLKGRIQKGETHLAALGREGVLYAEIRTLDVDPFTRTGIDLPTLRFLRLFLLACLLADSPTLGREEWQQARERHLRAALRGREPGLRMPGGRGGEIPAAQAALSLLVSLSTLAARMDEGLGGAPHQVALELMRQRILHPALLPSARIAAAVTESGGDFFRHGIGLLAADRRHALILAA